MQLADGRKLMLHVKSDYPRAGRVEVEVGTEKAERFPLRMRIPYWSAKTQVAVNGAAVDGVHPGEYLVLDRVWQPGDRIELQLDFTPHFWVGERECAGRVSIFRGPLLLAYDRRFNEMDPAELPTLDARKLHGQISSWTGRHPPFLLLDFATVDGRMLRLCDFASAGDGGAPYLSWLKVDGAAPALFRGDRKISSRFGMQGLGW